MALFAEKKKVQPERKTVSQDVVKVHDDHYFLRQIDHFRDRASKLQQDLSDREQTLEALQKDIADKEERLKELEAVVAARRQEEEDIRVRTETQLREMTYRLEARIDALAKEVEENLNIDSNLVGEQTDKFQWEFKQMSRQLDKMKDNLSDKTHQENLSSYRNMVTSLDEMGENLTTSLTESLKETQLNKESENRIKRPAILALVVSVLNFAGLAALMLYMAGMLTF